MTARANGQPGRRTEALAVIPCTAPGNACAPKRNRMLVAMPDLAPSRKKRLTLRRPVCNAGRSVLENTLIRGSPSRQSKALFSSNGFTPMGGMGQKYKTRKGNTASRRITVFNILPTSLENEAISQYGVAMSNSTITPVPSRPAIIKRLAGQANALAALLALFELLPAELLPAAQQESNLALCADIAGDMARDLSALVGDAA